MNEGRKSVHLKWAFLSFQVSVDMSLQRRQKVGDLEKDGFPIREDFHVRYADAVVPLLRRALYGIFQ